MSAPIVLNKRLFGRVPEGAVMVDRTSKWGNPFVIGKDGSRSEVIARHAEWLLSAPDRMGEVRAELRGKNLMCWCAPLSCHADTLLRLANDPAALYAERVRQLRKLDDKTPEHEHVSATLDNLWRVMTLDERARAVKEAH